MFSQDRKIYLEKVKNDLMILEGKLLNALEILQWKKPDDSENIQDMLTCPFDRSHQVKPENFEIHVQNCKLQSIGYKTSSNQTKQIIPESTKWYYENNVHVTEVNVDSSVYSRFGFDLSKKKDSSKDSKFEERPYEMDISKDAIIIDPKRILQQSLESENDENKTFNTPIDELRWIFSWSQVPKSYCILDLSKLSANDIKAYLIENLPQTYLSVRADGDIKLMQFIYDCLHGNNVGPNVLVEHVKEILKEKTHGVVLSLWKFLVTKILQKMHNFSKTDMEDSRRYGLCVMKANITKQLQLERNPAALNSSPDVSQSLPLPTSSNTITDVPLPMEYVASQLTPDQRKRIYDYVVEETKSLRTIPSVTYEDIEKDTETQLQMMAFEEEKLNAAPRSNLEVMAELRNFKRRRQTYRAKGTHVTRRTATKVLRDVIDEQMKYLEIIHQKFHKTDNEKKEDDVDKDMNVVNETPTLERSYHRDDEDDSRSKKRRHSSRDRENSKHDSDRRHQRHKRKHERSRNRSRSRDKESYSQDKRSLSQETKSRGDSKTSRDIDQEKHYHGKDRDVRPSSKKRVFREKPL